MDNRRITVKPSKEQWRAFIIEMGGIEVMDGDTITFHDTEKELLYMEFPHQEPNKNRDVILYMKTFDDPPIEYYGPVERSVLKALAESFQKAEPGDSIEIVISFGIFKVK